MSFYSFLSSRFRFFRQPKYLSLRRKLGYTFRHEIFLYQALTHPSLGTNGKNHLESYERLEFLGDSVLDLIISDFLFHEYPTAAEGELTEHRAQMVNQAALAAIGEDLGLSEFIRSQTVVNSPIEHSEAVLSDVMESIIGAIYLDGGLTAAQKVITRVFPLTTFKEQAPFKEKNFKGELIEFCHANNLPSPEFRTLRKTGPEHARIYTIGVILREKTLGIGQASSKKKAGQIAARNTLPLLKKDRDDH